MSQLLTVGNCSLLYSEGKYNMLPVLVLGYRPAMGVPTHDREREDGDGVASLGRHGIGGRPRTVSSNRLILASRISGRNIII